jgi:hypothetical protein
VLPRAPWLRISSPYRDGSRCHHVSRGPGTHLLAKVSFDAVICSSTPDLVLPDEVSSSAAMCPIVPDSASPRGEIRCCHMYHDPRRAVDHRNKEMCSCPSHATRVCVFKKRSCVIKASARRADHYSVALQCNTGPPDHS